MRSLNGTCLPLETVGVFVQSSSCTLMDPIFCAWTCILYRFANVRHYISSSIPADVSRRYILGYIVRCGFGA